MRFVASLIEPREGLWTCGRRPIPGFTFRGAVVVSLPHQTLHQRTLRLASRIGLIMERAR